MKFLLKSFLILFLFTTFAYSQNSGIGKVLGKWMSGDFHQHSYYTDGKHILDEVINNGFKYGLDFQANSEHGGFRIQDGYNHFWDDTNYYPVNPIKGDYKKSNGHQAMWRWQSLKEYAYPQIQSLRKEYQNKFILTGVEWNVPVHEHCDIMIEDLNNYSHSSVFEYYFDKEDDDMSNPFETSNLLPEEKMGNAHEKALAAAQWLQQNFAGHSWMIPTHPERMNLWHIEDFRDLNNAAPDVAFGFDGIPGHQKESIRGGFNKVLSVGNSTFGGAGYFISKVGGLWDALLGEGRHWWTFVNSDFHDTDGDFWPGEYAKTYAYAQDINGNGIFEINEIVKALQSGNAFVVHGDLINALDFTIKSTSTVTMGQELKVSKNENITITMAFKSPEKNNNNDKPVVDHIDLIAGSITGKVSKDNKNYTKDTNETTKVVKTFKSSDFKKSDDGYNKVTFNMPISNNMYFRLRGTNLAANTPYETDSSGNPLPDYEQVKLDGAAEAWADLWFYSNPIFVYIK